jgi:phosphatidylserine synthase
MMPDCPAVHLHPRNAATYAALLAGVGAIVSAIQGNPSVAGALVAAAALADTFDGMFARRFSRDVTQEAIGMELDSLADACTFAVAPVVCTATLGVPARSVLVLAALSVAAFAYVTCMVTRLAFYNTTRGTLPGFIGLPAPVAALLWSTALLITHDPVVLASVLMALALAMIAPLPIPRPTGWGLLAFALWPLVLVARHAAHHF